jgi:hypothetical protein
MANSIDENCRYNMIVRVGYILLIICVCVQCDYDETAKTHVGKFNEMNKVLNYSFFLVLAIVGGGIGGISTAYWLKYYLNDSVAITIYESKQVCY